MTTFIRNNLNKNLLINLNKYRFITLEKNKNMYQIIGTYSDSIGTIRFGIGNIISKDFDDVLLEYDNQHDAEIEFDKLSDKLTN